MYKRKTVDEYHIQGYYGNQYGYETVTTESNWKDAKEMLKCYRENEKGIPFRIKKVRVKKEENM
jgi:hypothetical protein